MNGNNSKLASALGFAMKAGKLAVGEFAADRALKAGKAFLIVVDEAASENTQKQWRDAAEFRRVELVTVPDMGIAIGKSGRMAAAVTDGNFAKMISKAANECGPANRSTPAEECGQTGPKSGRDPGGENNTRTEAETDE
ncbi:MAG: ribosomal L7Ae/L30e/S12e/Gadd45 family protein [Clostridia bacterium]|nr:ribosomal L7Ae/L30e/S12e/Gadd45 family protein [Clostridia bacterium]